MSSLRKAHTAQPTQIGERLCSCAHLMSLEGCDVQRSRRQQGWRSLAKGGSPLRRGDALKARQSVEGGCLACCIDPAGKHQDLS